MPIKTPTKTTGRRRAAPPVSIVPLDVTIEQENTKWCWAACVQTILKNRGSANSQCQLASAVPRLGGPCCGAPLPNRCNQGLQDDEITTLFRTFGVASVSLSGQLTDAQVTTELAAGRPVMVGFDWGHVCVIYGKQDGGFLFYDPLGPASGTVSLDAIIDYGQGTNNWQSSWTGL